MMRARGLFYDLMQHVTGGAEDNARQSIESQLPSEAPLLEAARQSIDLTIDRCDAMSGSA